MRHFLRWTWSDAEGKCMGQPTGEHASLNARPRESRSLLTMVPLSLGDPVLTEPGDLLMSRCHVVEGVLSTNSTAPQASSVEAPRLAAADRQRPTVTARTNKTFALRAKMLPIRIRISSSSVEVFQCYRLSDKPNTVSQVQYPLACSCSINRLFRFPAEPKENVL